MATVSDAQYDLPTIYIYYATQYTVQKRRSKLTSIAKDVNIFFSVEAAFKVKPVASKKLDQLNESENMTCTAVNAEDFLVPSPFIIVVRKTNIPRVSPTNHQIKII